MNCINEAENKNKEIEYWRIEYEKACDEMRRIRSDNEMLKDTIVRLTMKLVGVTD